MATAPIIFSHANGFPAGTYRLLFEAWQAAGRRVAAVERFGHDPRYPVSSNWPRLRDQLVDFIQAQGGGASVDPVSYTHLDVYKRQGGSRSGSSGLRCAP